MPVKPHPPVGYNEVLQAALDYWAAGLSVIPIRPDGTKAPALVADHPVLTRQRRATDDEVRRWWGNGRRGIAVLAGPISGNIRCVDFEAVADTRAVLSAWVNRVAGSIVGILDRLCLIETPSGGWHCWYKVEPSTPVGPGGKLAVRADGELLIEHRGDGQYALVPGSPTSCHPCKVAYRHDEGLPLTNLGTLTVSEDAFLLLAARQLSEQATEAPPVHATIEMPRSGRPGDIYNERGPSWADILTPHGWRMVEEKNGLCRWIRPGKTTGTSATSGLIGADGTELFHVFSSNAGIPPGTYSKFRLYGYLKHNGDLSAAAAHLRSLGYGAEEQPIKESPPSPAGPTPGPPEEVPSGKGGDSAVRLPPHPRKLARQAANTTAHDVILTKPGELGNSDAA